MKFNVYCFDIPRKKLKKGIDIDTDKFWNQVKEKDAEILKAKGCYIFALKKSRNKIEPWYVGKATKTFQQEATADNKIKKYLRCINDNKGKPCLFLIASKTKTDKFSTGDKKHVIDWLEKQLIYRALSRNTDLINEKGTKYFREVIVPGFLSNWRKGLSKNETKLKDMLTF
jgi:hypothetical protein